MRKAASVLLHSYEGRKERRKEPTSVPKRRKKNGPPQRGDGQRENGFLFFPEEGKRMDAYPH